MFGPDILVAPVVEKGAVTRRVYLPEGAEWTDAHTKEILTGGQWIPVVYKDGKDLHLFES